MKKYLLVNIVGSNKIPPAFPSKEWPLHLTLLVHFNTDRAVELLIEEFVQTERIFVNSKEVYKAYFNGGRVNVQK